MISSATSLETLERDLTVTSIDGIAGGAAAWDAFVARAEAGTFCHLAGWREILSDILGAECLYWVATSGGEIEGVLPLVRVRSWLFGHYLVSLPFLNYGGPLGSTAARQRLTQDAVSEALHSRVDLLELRTRDARDLQLPVSSRKITVILDLPPTRDELWKGFTSKLRNQLRRPLKEGYVTRFGLEHREAFYDVFARTMRDLGTPVLPGALFERIAAVFPERVVFGVVYGGTQPVAAGCGFVWGDEFEMTWAGARRETRGVGSNMLLYGSFMEEMIARGVRAFNFGRCTPDSGTHVFKRQWGSRDVPLPWCQFARNGHAATPSPKDPAFAWGPRLWRRLPLSLANLLGPRLVRFLP
ncbi:MAG TPA: FemAB family XrtA/PEP-CTERM system-associated protein [Gemmatimonadales bacterium]|jgi:FemAB-related protein (PEP-CTERM system-associated)|nr:FemAB family XrtA/PEP-CTERM system-associated protein [Gemmatimonadales bacterium]